MPIRMLAVDTASEICGVALAVDGKVGCEIIVHHGTTHTKTVMQAVDAALKSCRLTIAQIDIFAVTQGPGSFTGLRIGISTVKGLAVAMNRPMVGVSSLGVLAHQAAGDTPLVCSLMDARRNEVYWSLYRRRVNGLVPVVAEQVGPAIEIADHIDAECLLIGNGIRTCRLVLEPLLNERAQWAAEEHNGLRPAVLARLGWEKYLEDGGRDVNSVGPVYLRKSDAELKSSTGVIKIDKKMIKDLSAGNFS